MQFAKIFLVLALAFSASAYVVDVGTTNLGAVEPFVFDGTPQGWYDFHNAHRDSADTPDDVELSNTMVVAIVRPTVDNKHYVAVINDIPNDGSKGTASLQIVCGHGAGEAVFQACRAALQSVVQHDDGHESLTETSSGSGIFTISWVWAACCTDGIMVGPFDSNAVDLYIKNTAATGLGNGLKIAYPNQGSTEHTQGFGVDEEVHLHGQFSDLLAVHSCDCKNAQVSSDTTSVELTFAEDGGPCAP